MPPKKIDPRTARWLCMIEAGKSYGQIAKEDGVSRSTIAGAIHRMTGRTPTVNRYIEPVPNFIPAQTLPDFAAVLAADACRYITGDPRAGAALYCGHPRAPGSAFCKAHHKICYRPPASISAPGETTAGASDVDKKIEDIGK